MDVVVHSLRLLTRWMPIHLQLKWIIITYGVSRPQFVSNAPGRAFVLPLVNWARLRNNNFQSCCLQWTRYWRSSNGFIGYFSQFNEAIDPNDFIRSLRSIFSFKAIYSLVLKLPSFSFSKWFASRWDKQFWLFNLIAASWNGIFILEVKGTSLFFSRVHLSLFFWLILARKTVETRFCPVVWPAHSIRGAQYIRI